LGQNPSQAYHATRPEVKNYYEGGRRYESTPEVRARITELKAVGCIDPDDAGSVRAGIAEIFNRAMAKDPVLDRNGKETGVWRCELAIALAAAKALSVRTGALDRVDADSITEDMTPEQGKSLIMALAEKYGLTVTAPPQLEAVPAGTDAVTG
jgi:hypothetical protein